MRVRISNRINLTEEITPTNFVNVALAQLYRGTTTDQAIDLYARHTIRLLHRCCDGSENPVPNNIVEQLNDMIHPRQAACYLYIGSPEPSHYVILHRRPLGSSSDSAWVPITPRICKLTAKPQKDGIHMTWRSPEPLDAVGMAPTLSRVLSGGINTSTLTDDLAADPELQRELSLSIFVAGLFSQLQTITIWTEPGKVVCSIDQEPNNPFTGNFDVTPLRIRPYARPVTKPRVILWGDCPEIEEYAPDLPRHIVPQVKGAEMVTFSPEDRIASVIVTEAIMSRLLPVIGVVNASNPTKLSLFGLSYNPETKTPYTSRYVADRRVKASEGLPYISPVMEHAGPDSPIISYSPNPLFMNILNHYMFTAEGDDIESPANIARWQAIRRIMWGFGLRRIAEYADYLNKWGYSPDYAKLGLYGAMFQERR